MPEDNRLKPTRYIETLPSLAEQRRRVRRHRRVEAAGRLAPGLERRHGAAKLRRRVDRR